MIWLKRLWMTTLFCLSATWAAADALPLKIEIDLSKITNITDFPSPQVLEGEVYEFLNQHVDQALYKHWYVSQGAGISTLSLKIGQAGVRKKFNMLLTFSGDEHKDISHRGIKPESVPRQGDAFAEEIIDALYELIGDKSDKIFDASAFVYAETDDGLKTVLELDRPLDPENAIYFFKDKLELHWDHLARGITVDQSTGDALYTHMQLNAGETRSGVVKPDVKLSHAGALPQARLCLRRPLVQDPDDGTQPKVLFNCPLEGQCALQGVSPAGWASDDCEVPASHAPVEPPKWAWGAAYASTHAPDSWSVPNLDVLFDRVENFPGRFVGFTEFEVRTDRLRGIDADAYSARVTANDTQILVNGEAPHSRLRPFDPARGLIYRFGLENLKFVGRADGCEGLGVSFQFYKDSAPVGDPLELTRGYAALRHAPLRRFDTAAGVFRWSGDYVAPSARNESGMFVVSALFQTGDAASERAALAFLNDKRARLDGYGWTIKASELGLGLGLESVLQEDVELKLIGKLRPPRTIRDNGQGAYGVVIGVQEPSGQLQFTFDREQMSVLRRFFENRRSTSRSVRADFPDEPFVFSYGENRRTGPDWVC